MFGAWAPQLLMPFSQWGRIDALSLLNCKLKQIMMCPCEKLEISKFGCLCAHCSILRGFSRQYTVPLYLKMLLKNSPIAAKFWIHTTLFFKLPSRKKTQNQKKWKSRQKNQQNTTKNSSENKQKNQEKPNFTHIHFKVLVLEKTIHSSWGYI